MDCLELLAIQGTLKSLLQHHSSKASVLWCSAFFMVQLSYPYMTTGKTIALTRWTFVGKVISLLFNMLSRLVMGFPVAQLVKNLLAVQKTRVHPWVGKIPWRRKWQPTPVSLPGKSHGQRSLVDCSPWGRKESGTTEGLTHTHIVCLAVYLCSSQVLIFPSLSLLFLISCLQTLF